MTTYSDRGSTVVGGRRYGTSAVSVTQSVPYPPTVNNGDLLMMTLYGQGSNADADTSFTNPSGWTTLFDVTTANRTSYAATGPDRAFVLYKTADGSEGGGSISITGGSSFNNLSLTSSGGTQWMGEILRFVDQGAAAVSAATTTSEPNGAAASTADAPDYSAGGRGLICCMGFSEGSSALVTARGFSTQFSDSSTQGSRILLIPFLHTIDGSGVVDGPEVNRGQFSVWATFGITSSGGWKVGSL